MNQHNLAYLKDVILKAVHAVGFEVNPEDLHLEKTKTLEHGHFASNVAMFIAKKYGQSPREAAQKIMEAIKDPIIKKAEIAGPGFINVFVEQKFYTDECRSLCKNLDIYIQESLGFKPGEKTLLIDTSHPNVAKPMGVHHLLSTIIGSALAQLYRKIGYNVINDNYIGDWGTQFGKLIYAIHTWGDLAKIEKDPIPELLTLYVRFHEESEKDPTLDDHGRAEFKKLEEGDSESRKLWRYIVEISLSEFQKLYKRLGVTFDVINGESFYENKMESILNEGRKAGIIVDGEKEAWIIKPEDPNDPPTVVRKSDGATLYMTRDLARIKYWEETWHPDLMVNVVDVAQSLYFRQLFSATDKLNLTKAHNVHVNFGRMSFKDGKMSTRKGNILKLEEVLDEAEERALKLAREKAIELSEEEQKELARIMGIGAVKYNILSQNRVNNITFDWDLMLSFEGNSVPYLMYTATRAQSILKKAGVDEKEVESYSLQLDDDHEKMVITDLMMYTDALHRAGEEFKPNHIANYLYALAQDYNALYNALSILQAEDNAKKTRLLLTLAVIRVVKHGLTILGIDVPEKM
ncbi:arginine--tRNA ligase [Candidatus Peregrinibacteria bacterium CG_4_10_14_0_2_um_filter_43_11]|nr:MAG: arginine--tRNA ligase [Candidatus Peregrinibacteria bacterium CG_4_10_14_0_2_um_filter_43_11]